jgi:hypothetical protein
MHANSMQVLKHKARRNKSTCLLLTVGGIEMNETEKNLEYKLVSRRQLKNQNELIINFE